MNTRFNSNVDQGKQYSRNLKVAFKPRVLAVLISALMSHAALADSSIPTELNQPVPTATFDEIKVLATQSKVATEATKDVKTSKDIQNNRIDNDYDLVRYNSDISVADAGRYGSNGFAIRGVDGNRVALNFDGVALPDKQVNEIFSVYGKMFEGRFSPDVELLSEAELQVGSDSFASGSGAMGGAVNYKTKDPYDLIKPGNQLGGYIKVGYADRNEETSTAVGLAGANDKVEAMVNVVYREGHELKNHRMIGFNKDKLKPGYDFENDPDYRYPATGYKNNNAAILPDPLSFDSIAGTAKVYYHLSDEHRVGLQGTYQHRDHESNIFSKKGYGGERIAKDESELTSYGLNYRYLPMDNTFIDDINAKVSYQEVKGIAHTETQRIPSGATEYELDEITHRPQTDKTTQISVDGRSLAIETASLGTHNLAFNAKYAKNDHELILKEIYEPLKDNDETRYTFLGPAVKQDIFSIAISDSIDITDKLTTKIGVRYDDYHYKPYIDGITKKAIENTNEFYPVRLAYENGELAQKRRMNDVSGLFAIDYKLTPQWQLGYKLSTGFKVPSSSQMYSAFEILGNNLTPNIDLKPEKSLNHELTLAANYDSFNINATGFYTDYDDFIDTYNYQKYQDRCYRDSDGQKQCSPLLVNVISANNIGAAKTWGVRLGGMWDMSEFANTDGKIRILGNITYSKDKTDKGTNLLATQPLNGVLGLNYESPNQDYQLNANLRYLGAKKAEDAKVVDLIYNGWDVPSTEVIVPYKYIDKSESAFVYDVYGSKKFGKGLILSAGVYNVFDEKYVPWSNLRSLAELSMNSLVDKEGVGIERYTAPGRNYKVGLTYEF